MPSQLPPRQSRVLASLALLLLVLSPSLAAASEDGAFAAALASGGALYAVGVAFVMGLAACLTPCVFPMITITVSIFGGASARDRRHGFTLSLAFLAGIVLVFAPLGFIAGWTGALFGAALQNQLVLLAVSALFLTLAAGFFGAFELALPSALQNRLTRVGGLGHKGALGVGAVAGLIGAPCTGPFLVSLLVWLGKTQDAVLGLEAMMAFSVGLALPFMLVATFAVQLPKGGRWMLHVKSVAALAMTTVALYFADLVFPALGSWVERQPRFFVGAAAALALGLALGAIHRDFRSPLMDERLLKSGGVLLSASGAFVLLIALLTPARTLAWRPLAYQQASADAQAEGRPLLVDFTASWCGACQQLDAQTFADPAVNREAGRFVAIKVDASDDEDPQVRRAMAKLGVVGLPAVVLFDSSGAEVQRFTEFVPPGPFLRAIGRVE